MKKRPYTVQRAIKRGGQIHEAGAVMELTEDEAARLVEIGALSLVELDWGDSAAGLEAAAKAHQEAAEQAAAEKAAADQAQADKEAQAAADKAKAKSKTGKK